MAKQPPPLTLIKRLQEAQKRSTYWRDGYAPLLADAIEALINADHAVALELEAIAVWMVTPEVYDMWPDDMARLIRDGDHHANTPPNAQERSKRD